MPVPRRLPAVLELHELHQYLRAATKRLHFAHGPVGLRPKGRIEPLFSNQIDMLMLQFLPEQLNAADTAPSPRSRPRRHRRCVKTPSATARKLSETL